MRTNIQLKVFKSFENIYTKCSVGTVALGDSLCKDTIDYKGKPFTITYDSYAYYDNELYISFVDYENQLYKHVDIKDLSTLSPEEFFQESLVWDLEFPMPLVHKMIILIKETKQEPNGAYEEHTIEY